MRSGGSKARGPRLQSQPKLQDRIARIARQKSGDARTASCNWKREKSLSCCEGRKGRAGAPGGSPEPVAFSITAAEISRAALEYGQRETFDEDVTMADEQQTHFDRLGGAEALEQYVDEMYDRVLADPELAPFFENAQMDRLRRLQYEFLARTLDGPVQYTGGDLAAVHIGRGISRHHFSQFVGHLADVLEEHGVAQADVDLVLARLALHVDSITGSTTVDG